MQLFLLGSIFNTPEFKPWYDKSFHHVVRAHNELEARELAKEEAGNEGEAVWLDKNKTWCEVLSPDGDVEHIVVDFRAA